MAGTVAHALPIVGTMETVSKTSLCFLVLGATAWAVLRSGAWGRPGRP